MAISSEGNANVILEDHFSQIYENTLSINTPLVSTPDYLRRTRKGHIESQVRKVLSSSYEERKKILDPLVEYVMNLDLSNPQVMMGAIEDLKEKLEENPDYGSYFDRLEGTFKSLSPDEKRRVMRMSITNMQSNIHAIRHETNDQIMVEKDPYELILLDQILYTISGLFERTLSELDKEKTELNLLSPILVLTLRLECVRRERISITDLEQDLSHAITLLPLKHTAEGLTKETRKSVLNLL